MHRNYLNDTQNIGGFLHKADLDSLSGRLRVNKFKATKDFVGRLGFVGELDGHSGCVNCLEWSDDGRLLASGSDDCLVNIWDPFRRKKLLSIPSGHQGNIFSVKFVPNTGNQKVITGAADNGVRMLSTINEECLTICSCHNSRVKRIATDPNCPSLYWSAGEDGLILQHDSRVFHTCETGDTNKPKNVLIDLTSYFGLKAEAKAIAVNPIYPEIIAVGANDPFARVYDRRMIRLQNPEKENGEPSNDPGDIPSNSIQYFVPGHIPLKMGEYNKKYRSLSITYLTFSEDGTELLVNCGGEQIYLYPLRPDLQRDYNSLIIPELSGVSPSCKNGYTSNNGYKNGICPPPNGCSTSTNERYYSTVVLPDHIEELKRAANEAFKLKKYSQAIHMYNEALDAVPNSAVLLGNRASALLHRKWDGDVYAALQDSFEGLKLDPAYHKLYIRLSRALIELSRLKDAEEIYNEYKKRFPAYASLKEAKNIYSDIQSLLSKEREKEKEKLKRSGSSKSSGDTSFMSSSSATSANSSPPQHSEPSPTLNRSFFLRFTNSSDSSNSSHGPDQPAEENEDLDRDNENDPDEPNSDSSTNNSRGDRSFKVRRKIPRLIHIEDEKKGSAVDFQTRYCGHSNCTTDIKECNFFGNCVVAGSDDGNFVFWDRKTTNIVHVLAGDDSIVNCVQSHPTQCLMATSGIEHVVRLWGPLPEIPNCESDRLVTTDWNEVASENQKRMQSNPFEVILMNMGYRIEDDDEPRGVQCNQQ